MQINVTQKHIDEGCAGSRSNCPVAKAIADVFKSDDCLVEVDTDFILVNQTITPSPQSVKDFIHDFDVFKDGKPFSFPLPYFCSRSACYNDADGYRIWNNPTFFPQYRDYCVSCGQKIVELNADDEIKLKYRKLFD